MCQLTQTVNQVLKDLQARGILRLAYGEIELLDFAGLRELAHKLEPALARE